MERMDDGALASVLLGLERKRRDQTLSREESDRREQLRQELLRRFTSPPGVERRVFERIPAELEVKLRVGQASITCPARELSLGGLSLSGHLWVSEEQDLLLENLRAGRRDYPMAIRARVVWKISDEDRRPMAGLQFVDLDQAGTRQLNAVLEQLYLDLVTQLTC